MKKHLKLIFSFLILLAVLLVSKIVDANSIDSISMYIYIDNSGNDSVTEVWSCYTNQGTEVYHPYYNLGNSVISNLSVLEGNTNYTTLPSWNTSGTLDNKAYKCGINKISNGVELCWGISSYGSHTYTVNYNISNFVADLTDSQMIYWTLIPYEFSNTIGNVYIKIHTNFDIPQTTDVWGYGNYGGTCYVYDGYIEMQSEGTLGKSEYMTILAKFPEGTFNVADNSLKHDFNYYYNMSQEGSINYEENSSNFSVFSIFDALFSLMPFFIFLFSFIFVGKRIKESSLTIDKEAKKAVKNAEYFRAIPCNKDLYLAYYVATKYGLANQKTNLLGSVILTWLKNGIIKIEKRETGKIFKKENSVIILDQDYLNKSQTLNLNNFDDLLKQKEFELYKMLFEASKDGILENKEFETWCSKHYSTILNWFDNVISIVDDKLVNEKLIITTEKKKFGFLTLKLKCASSTLNQYAVELSGLKKYLNDYTLISDREAIEVTLFEDYLIFAQMLGIANKVAKEFKELYPDIIEQSNFYSYDYILFINTCSYNGISRASASQSRAQSYSSGGGGFSSGGGGGGSFGGGGGGGGFR